MAMSIIPRPVRDRLNFQTDNVLCPALVQAASAWAGADAHRVDTVQPLKQQTRPALRRCDNCQLDLGREVLRALGACPRWGQPRAGAESHCPAFVRKPVSTAQGGGL